MLRVTPQPLPLALVELISASRLAHPFAFSPPSLASAKRGFRRARSLVSVCLATHRFHDRLETCLDQCLPPSISLRAPVPRGLSIRVAQSCDRALNEEAMRFHDACSASADRRAFSWGAFSSPACPMFPQGNHELCDRASDTSVAFPLLRWARAPCIESSRTPRPLSPCLREKNTASATRDAFHRRVIAPALRSLAKTKIGAASDRSHDFAAVIRPASFVRPPWLRCCSRSFASPRRARLPVTQSPPSCYRG